MCGTQALVSALLCFGEQQFAMIKKLGKFFAVALSTNKFLFSHTSYIFMSANGDTLRAEDTNLSCRSVNVSLVLISIQSEWTKRWGKKVRLVIVLSSNKEISNYGPGFGVRSFRASPPESVSFLWPDVPLLRALAVRPGLRSFRAGLQRRERVGFEPSGNCELCCSLIFVKQVLPNLVARGLMRRWAHSGLFPAHLDGVWSFESSHNCLQLCLAACWEQDIGSPVLDAEQFRTSCFTTSCLFLLSVNWEGTY